MLVVVLTLAVASALVGRLVWRSAGGDGQAGPGQPAAAIQPAAHGAVAALFVGDKRSCSAVLISSDEALTAAHCVAGRAAETVSLATGPRAAKGGDGRRRVLAIVLARDPSPASPGSGPSGPADMASELASDLALLHLAPAATPQTGSAAASVTMQPWPSPQGEFADVLGYERDGPPVLAQREGCMVLAVEAGVVTLACDVAVGLSGAPVFRQLRPGMAPALVAILVARSPGRAYALLVAPQLEALRAAP